jgi:CBS domain containing-hemolysin-like protein
LVTFFILLGLSAFFSASETALTAINKIKLKHLVKHKVKNAFLLQKLLEKPRDLLTTILFGNTLVNIANSILGAIFFTFIFNKIGVTSIFWKTVSTTIFMTFVILTFGEVLPKTFAIIYSEKIALFIVKIINILVVLAKPITCIFEGISIFIFKTYGIDYKTVSKLLTQDEIKTIVSIGEEEGVIQKREKTLIKNIFEFSKTTVKEIMTPRTDTIFVDGESSIKDTIHLIIEHGHSRVPVYEEKIDNILGVVYAKDLLSVASIEETSVKKFIREAIFIPETQSIEKLLQQMKKSKFHIAMVIDEYGGVSGIVTLEDILEEIIGEIQDEHDQYENPDFLLIGENHYLIDAGINIDDLSDELNFDFPKEEDYDTIGGFVLYLLGRIPHKGEIIKYKNLEFKIKEIVKRRILKLEIKKYPNLNEDLKQL